MSNNLTLVQKKKNKYKRGHKHSFPQRNICSYDFAKSTWTCVTCASMQIFLRPNILSSRTCAVNVHFSLNVLNLYPLFLCKIHPLFGWFQVDDGFRFWLFIDLHNLYCTVVCSFASHHLFKPRFFVHFNFFCPKTFCLILCLHMC